MDNAYLKICASLKLLKYFIYFNPFKNLLLLFLSKAFNKALIMLS